jgi:hypothetical protein
MSDLITIVRKELSELYLSFRLSFFVYSNFVYPAIVSIDFEAHS